jgi:hypothetical protein
MNVLRYSRLRLLGLLISLVGLAALSSSQRGISPFLLSPFGLGLGALVLHLVGSALEEVGTILRIRAGAAARVLAALALVAGAAVALEHAPPSAAGWLMQALVGVGLVWSLAFAVQDARVAADPRAGQRLRLVGLSATGIGLRVGGAEFCIPAEAISSVSITRGARGRGALLRLDAAGVGREAIPLLEEQTAGGDVLLELTEHEAGLDAEVLARRLRALSGRGPTGYR